MTVTAGELAARVRAGELDPVHVTQEALARIAAVNGVLGAFRVVRTEAAVEEAKALRDRPDLRELPLAGVPVAVKDVVAVSGECVTVGSRATRADLATADHEIVSRLRKAGAVIVGITRVPELCAWATSDDPSGTARNPWDPAYTAGGSSGGSGSAVAAGLVPIAHGTDGLGSVRLPAAICGLVGIKPGRDVVTGFDEPSWYGMSSHGPLATTVADAALLLSVLAGRPDLAEVAEPEGRLRVAVSTRPPLATPVPRPLRQAATGSAALLSGAGHLVESATPRYGLSCPVGLLSRWVAGPVETAEGWDRTKLQRRMRRHLTLGDMVLRRGLMRESFAERWTQHARDFFERHDVLLTPAFATLPLKARAWHERSWLANAVPSIRFAPFTGPWNLAGFPAMSVPAGFHPSGVPLGVQVVAAPGKERLLLGVAAQLERLAPWPRTVADRPT